MRFQRKIPAVLVALLVSACSTAVKQDNAEIPRTIEQANAQRERAAEMKRAAEARLAAEEDACYRKFLVSACLKEAKAR